MKCEVHSSDLDVFINALKRVAEDVRSIPEEKGNALFYYYTIKLFFIIKISYGGTFILVHHVTGPIKSLNAPFRFFNVTI